MALTEVSAFKNLSIINEDINGSAAIDGSKISPSFTSNVTITNSAPRVDFVDNNSDSDFRLQNFNGSFVIHDISENLTRFALSSDGTATFYQNLNANSGLDVSNGDITGVLGSTVTGTTQSAGDNSTKIATTAYVDGASVSTEQVQDIVGAMFTGNTETNITATYQDSDGTIDLVASAGGGGSSSQLTDTNGTVKVEVDTSTIFLRDNVEVRDSVPTIYFRSSDGNTNYGWFRSFSASTEIFNRVSGGETKFKVQAGSSTINKILFRQTSGGTQTNPDVCIGRSMTASGKPTDLSAFFPHTGGVELYHISGNTGTKKFETTANGITVQGSVTTEDINMSNLNASANEVDNTKGSWTIQEGASDLFLINRVNGKKYKFNLTEIS